MGFWSGFWVGVAAGYVTCLATVMMVLSLCYVSGKGKGADEF